MRIDLRLIVSTRLRYNKPKRGKFSTSPSDSSSVSFKRVHSLYGMAAPVTCMDVSDDNRLLMTGSGDKTVRLWELQFGNCLRRFVEHTEP